MVYKILISRDIYVLKIILNFEFSVSKTSVGQSL